VVFCRKEGSDCSLVGAERGKRERGNDDRLVLVGCTSVIPVTRELCSTSGTHDGHFIIVCVCVWHVRKLAIKKLSLIVQWSNICVL
jgi:hypothetical protein